MNAPKIVYGPESTIVTEPTLQPTWPAVVALFGALASCIATMDSGSTLIPKAAQEIFDGYWRILVTPLAVPAQDKP